MFCDQCGNRMPDNARFCSECGNRVVLKESVSSAPDEVAASPPAEETKQPEAPVSVPTSFIAEPVRPADPIVEIEPPAREPSAPAWVQERPATPEPTPAPEQPRLTPAPEQPRPTPVESPAWAINAPAVAAPARRRHEDQRTETILAATPAVGDAPITEAGGPVLVETTESKPWRVSFFRRLVSFGFDVAFLAIVPIIMLEMSTTSSAPIVYQFVAAALVILYFPVGFAVGRTVGAWATHTRIVQTDTENTPGLLRGILRFAVMIVSLLVVFLGFLWSLWDLKRQTWHDKAAGTTVIDTHKKKALPSLV